MPSVLTGSGPLRRRLAFVLAAFLTGVLLLATPAAQRPNDTIVILISFDGWRWDYTERADVPHLRALASRGVLARGLIPVFPSKTFPNHYTIVTGLHPERHGIVSNVILDPSFPTRFTMSSATSRDPRWWAGEPVWVTAGRQGLGTASMFWPGSEVSIGGWRPTYWRPFDDALPNADRVKQVLEWLALPAGERPTFVTLYFSEVDTAGHRHGPESPEVLAAAQHLDAALGNLIAGVRALNLVDRTAFVIVSDHGMSEISDRRVVFLDDYVTPSDLEIVELSPNLGVIPRAGSEEAVYWALKDKHLALSIYRRGELPARLHYANNTRIPPILGLVDDGWTVTTRAGFQTERAAGRLSGGAHGYDPIHRSMHGLFAAAGPGIRSGLRVDSFDNVHVYDLLCRLLGIAPAANDGDPEMTRRFLVE